MVGHFFWAFHKLSSQTSNFKLGSVKYKYEIPLAGYIWNYWNLPRTWFYWCCVGSWTSWCARWFNYKSSTFWPNCLLWITQRGKYFDQSCALWIYSLAYISLLDCCNYFCACRLPDMILKTKTPLGQCLRLTLIWF